ncbi:MAG: DUF126 domain-containing protein [Rhizobiaceae bacterium]
MTAAQARIIIDGGKAAGKALVLGAPISFWGGVDPKTGTIIDVRHPEHGAGTAGTVLFVPATAGSSTASTILLELVHVGRAPAAIVLHEPDAILLLGLVAAREMGLAVPPALALDRALHGQFAGKTVTVEDGTIRTSSG